MLVVSLSAGRADEEVGLAGLVDAATAARKAGDLDRARDLFSTALDALRGLPGQQKNIAFLENQRAAVELEDGKAAAAQEGFARAVELEPDAARAAQYAANLGNAALEAGDAAAAGAAFDRARRAADPAVSARGLEGLGRIALRAGLGVTAAEWFAEAYARNPDAAAAKRADIAQRAVQGYLAARRPDQAREWLERAAADREAAGGDRDYGYDGLVARVDILSGKHAAARQLLEELIEAGRTGAASRAVLASALYNLAELDFRHGRYSEADETTLEAQLLFAEVHGAAHPVVGQAIHRRALVFQELGDLERSGQLYDEALALFAETLDAGHPFILSTLIERSQLMAAEGAPETAADEMAALLQNPFFETDDGAYAGFLANAALGLARKAAGARGGAIEALEAAVAKRTELTISPVDLLPSLLALAELRAEAGETVVARALAREAAEIMDGLGIASIALRGEADRLLAELDWAAGAQAAALRRGAEMMDRIGARIAELSLRPTISADFAPVQIRGQVGMHLDHLLAAGGDRNGSAIFEAMQLLHMHETTKATSGYLARLIEEDSALGRLLVRRKAVTDGLRALEDVVGAEGANVAGYAALTSELARLDRELSAEHPQKLFELQAGVVPLETVQAALAPGEAMWLHTAFAERSVIAWVTRDTLQLSALPVGIAALKEKVDRLRYALDADRGGGRTYPVDLAAELFRDLFGPVSARISQVRRIVVIPDGPAQELPLAPLVMASDGAGTRYLGLEKAILRTPSVHTWRLLGQTPTAGRGRGFVGFADPDLGAGPTDETTRSVSLIDRLSGLARPDAVRRLFGPLHETRGELETLSGQFAPDRTRLFFADLATETTVKATDFADAEAVVFATHAIVAGDFDALSEPALILTPPQDASRRDDGLLTASEIASLDIPAELVILSACDTAAPSGRSGAAGLSGLASGFFRAGARRLLVSQWTIASEPTVLLTTGFFDHLNEDPARDAPEALRQAMRRLQDIPGKSYYAHPTFWAPFVVVGVP
ncbi:MAG: CHAT domain-containing protein [Maritimibacter sp.]|nr:CHAT domain-containing protein [Maritimibacter sp.]